MSDKLLYDIVQLLDWPVEEEKVDEPNDYQVNAIKIGYNLIKTASKAVLSFVPLAHSRTNSYLILDALGNLALHKKWKFSVSPNRKYVVILQKQLMEMRYLNDITSVVGIHDFSKEEACVHKILSWSQNSSLCAVAFHSSKICLYDTLCTRLSTIDLSSSEGEVKTSDTSKSVCAMMFITARTKSKEWQWELLILTYSGLLLSYFVSSNGNHEFYHKFNFGGLGMQSISCALADQTSRLFILGGNACFNGEDGQEIIGCLLGINKWRILSDYPYYKKDEDLFHDGKGILKRGLLKRIYSSSMEAVQKFYYTAMDGVYIMALSPNQDKLIAVHYNGVLSLWHFPSLKLKSKWNLEQQPFYSETDPNMMGRLSRKRRRQEDSPVNFYPYEISWWSNDAVIIVRFSGCLTIVSVAGSELVNLLGDQCEWVSPGCQLSLTVSERFYMLERHTEPTAGNKRRRGDTDEDDESASIVQRGVNLAKEWSGMSEIPIDERSYNNKYSLNTFTKTTPQELYERKLDDKEFGEALSIAQAYNLDCDKVFQRQWRISPVSKASIQDYLSKVENKSWVFRECMDRVPERLDDAKELYDFALQVTDIDQLAKITNKDVDDDEEEELDEYDGFDYEVQQQRILEQRLKFENKWMKHVNLKKLTAQQNDMLACRQKILKYKDRLSTYILLMGGYDATSERYTAEDFAVFRKRDVFQLALEYARSDKWESVDILFQYHFDQLSSHRLPLLSNFSETTSPKDYRCLLPAIENDKILPSFTQQHRSSVDWAEKLKSEAQGLDTEEFYEENDFLLKFSTDNLTPALVSEWFQQRAKQMEKLTRQTEEAIQLLQLGIDNGVSGLSELYFDIKTLDNLLFECGCDLSMSLDDLLKKTPLERIHLLMFKTSPTTFIHDLQELVIPFVKTCNDDSLLMTYFVETAKSNLVLPLLVFKYMCTHKISDCNFKTDTEVINTAVECILAMEDAKQLDIAYRVLACLPKGETHKKSALKQKIASLERNLDACGLLAKHKVFLTPAELKSISEERQQVLLLYKRLARSLAREASLNAVQCKNLLEDMLDITSKMFSHVIDKPTCIHVLIESLLTSGVLENIKLAGEMMIQSEDKPSFRRDGIQLPYKDSVDLVLSSSREYFDAASIPLHNNKLLHLSRSCLLLITDHHPGIKEQLDLIEAVSLVSAFGLEMLPLEVRLCNDRLEIVQKILNLSPLNYTKVESILRLALLLNVTGDNLEEKKCRTACAIIDKALEHNDHKVACQLVQQLIEANYSQAWRICVKLGTCKDIHDLSLRRSCISFASCYCDDEDLILMSDELRKVTALLLEQALEDQMTEMEEEDEYEEAKEDLSSQLLSVPGSHTLKASANLLAGTVNATSQILLSGLSTLNSGSQRFTSKTSIDRDNVSSEDPQNADFELQSCPTFYKSVIPTAITDQCNTDYADYASTNKLSVTHQQIMLRINALAKLDDRILGNVMELAVDMATKDLALSISYLLSISDAKSLEECFHRLPLSSLSLQLQIYLHALQTMSERYEASTECLPIYRTPPSSFIDYCMRHCNPRRNTGSLTALQQAVSSLVAYMQGEKLSSLGHDIDITRCEMDSQYAEETTHGLAMSTDEEQFFLAILLADQASLDIWEVIASHVEYLFTETGEKVDQSELFAKLKRLNVLSALLSRGRDLYVRFDKQVFPLIDGHDYSTLLCYFSLLKECNWSEIESVESINDIVQLPPQTHIKYLQKLTHCASGVDYKLLISKNSSQAILDMLKENVNANNVSMLSKLIPKIPYKNETISQSSVLLCWIQKQFWFLGKPKSLSDADWFKRLEQANKWLPQLSCSDVRSFFNDVLYSQASLDTFTYELRSKFLKFGIKFVKQQQSSNLSREEEKDFEQLAVEFSESNSHFSVFTSSFVKQLIEKAKNDKEIEYFLKEFDKSKSKPNKVLPLMIEQATKSVDFTKRFLTVLANVKWNIEYIVKTCACSVIQQLREQKEKASYKIQLASLEQLLLSIEGSEVSEKAKLFQVVVAIVEEFCNEPDVDVSLKIDMLQLLRKSAALKPSQAEFLLFHRTSELIKSEWDEEVADEVLKDIENISQPVSHNHIISVLLNGKTSLNQVKTASNIIEILEQNSDSSSKDTNSWMKVLLDLAEHGPAGGEEIVNLAKRHHFNDQISQSVFEKLIERSLVLAAVKLALIANTTDVSEKLHKVLDSVDQVDETNCDDEMLQLLIDSQMVLSTLSTLYYHRVVQYLLLQDYENVKDQVNRLVRQLQDSGHMVEAATLLMRYRGSHTAFATFGSSMSLISDWLKKF